MSRIHAFRMIQSSEVCKNLLPMGNIQPTSERQARPLTRLSAPLQIEAWEKVVERNELRQKWRKRRNPWN